MVSGEKNVVFRRSFTFLLKFTFESIDINLQICKFIPKLYETMNLVQVCECDIVALLPRMEPSSNSMFLIAMF